MIYGLLSAFLDGTSFALIKIPGVVPNQIGLGTIMFARRRKKQRDDSPLIHLGQDIFISRSLFKDFTDDFLQRIFRFEVGSIGSASLTKDGHADAPIEKKGRVNQGRGGEG